MSADRRPSKPGTGALAVAMGTYNGERWLGEQLASIEAQARRPDRVIVSDDGSTDGTPEILEEFAARSPLNVTLLEGPRAGFAANFWHAALAATDCELIAWCDQDDVWSPSKLELCERALVSHEGDLVSHSALTVDEDGRPLGSRFPDYGSARVLEPLHGNPWHVPSGFASVFRRRLLDGTDFDRRPRSHQVERPVGHDHLVALRAFAEGRRIQLAQPLASYRQHDRNVSGAWSVSGLAALRLALAVGGPEFSGLAAVAQGYAAFVERTLAEPVAAARYFHRLADRCRRRSALYDRDRSRAARLRALARSARLGDYGPASGGGFGARGLAKELAALGLGEGPVRRAQAARR